jgi:hypothetical protein
MQTFLRLQCSDQCRGYTGVIRAWRSNAMFSLTSKGTAAGVSVASSLPMRSDMSTAPGYLATCWAWSILDTDI